jgi:hypothetical protein
MADGILGAFTVFPHLILEIIAVRLDVIPILLISKFRLNKVKFEGI